MRIMAVNSPMQILGKNVNNSHYRNMMTTAAPAFGYGFDDASFLDEPSNGYSILDLVKWLRGGKPSKPTQEQIDKVLETWDPDLGDISDIVDPKRNNFGPLDEALKEFSSGKLNQKQLKKESEPPSIFIYTDEND